MLTLANATTGGILQQGSGNDAALTVNAVGGGGATLTEIGDNLKFGDYNVSTTSSVDIIVTGPGAASYSYH